MKGWQKIAVGIVLVVVPGSLVVGSLIGIYKFIDKKCKEKKEEQKDG